jgi:hypothetical protein
MKMKRLFLSVTLIAPMLCWAQDAIKIGRSQLSLPDASRWSTEQVNMPGIGYGGDISGVIPVDGKRMTLRNESGLIKAIVTASMTKSAVNGQMSFSNHCANIKPNDNVFTLDKGSPVRVDCLMVIKVLNTAVFMTRIDGTKVLFNSSQPHTASAYYVQFDLGLANGAKTGSFVLLAEGFQGIPGEAISNNSKIPDGVIRWATAFAKANSSGLTSFSGDWTLPALSFN